MKEGSLKKKGSLYFLNGKYLKFLKDSVCRIPETQFVGVFT